ncbi:MAG: AsmA-like C-terminal region-containing protein, partial [Candidatus Sumerlaeota bacterium]
SARRSRAASPGMPGPVMVRTLDVMASRDAVDLRTAEIDFSGMKIRASGIVPICSGDADKVGEVTISAEGNTESVFDFLNRKGLTPAEMNYARLPVSIDVVAQGRIDCDDPIRTKVMTPRLDGLSGSIAWKLGEIGLRDFAEPIRLEPGRVVYTDGDLTVERFSASAQHISLKADGKVSNLPLPMHPSTTKPVIDGTVSSVGEIPDLLTLLNKHMTLPDLPRDIAGQYQLTLSGNADTAELLKTDYKLRLLLDKVSATVETPSRPVHIADFSTDVRLDRDVAEVRRANLRISDEETGDSTVDFKVSVDRNAIRADADVRTKLELLPSLLPKDLKDIYMKGTLAATGWARFTPKTALTADKSIVEAWVEFLKKPDLSVDVKGTPDLLVDFELVNKQEDPVEIFPRDFPVRVSNVRGGARFTPDGIILKEIRADFGSAKDVLTSGTIRLGHPAQVDFSADIKELDLNEWMSGWGEREWASYSASFEPRWKSIPEPYQMAIVNANIKTEKLHFLRYDAEQIQGDMHFESWSRIPSVLNVTNIEGLMYGGPSKGDLRFQLVHDETPIVTFKGDFNRVELKPFMDALYEREQKMDGFISTQANFSGQLMNYPTYKGDARYTIERSSVVGNVILDYARSVFQLTSTTGLNTSTVTGSVSMYDQKVFLPDLVIKNPNINLTADGYLDFRGRIFFDVTASVLAKRLQEIPLIRILGNAIDLVGNEIVSYEVRGTLKEPKYKAVLTPVGRLMSIREVLKQSQKDVVLPQQEQLQPAALPPSTTTNGQK